MNNCRQALKERSGYKRLFDNELAGAIEPDDVIGPYSRQSQSQPPLQVSTPTHENPVKGKACSPSMSLNVGGNQSSWSKPT